MDRNSFQARFFQENPFLPFLAEVAEENTLKKALEAMLEAPDFLAEDLCRRPEELLTGWLAAHFDGEYTAWLETVRNNTR